MDINLTKRLLNIQTKGAELIDEYVALCLELALFRAKDTYKKVHADWNSECKLMPNCECFLCQVDKDIFEIR